MSRRKSRQTIIQILYRDEFHTHYFKKNEKEKSDFFLKYLNEEDTLFILKLIQNIQAHKKELDTIIKDYTKHWKLERISLVDRNIMRLAIFEMLCCPNIPDRSSLNEALELAKQFGEEKSVSFINGILDQVLKNKATNLTKLKQTLSLK